MTNRQFAQRFMGRVVKSTAVLVRHKERTVQWLRRTKDVYGWATGIRTVYDGHVIPGNWDSPPTWCPAEGHRVVLLAERPSTKPIHVPIDTIELSDVDPLVVNHLDAWPKSARELWREEMSVWPRDEKGRWVACSWCRECSTTYPKGQVHVCPAHTHPDNPNEQT